MRYIVTIRKPGDPVCYYLTGAGFRGYTPELVRIFHSHPAAFVARDHHAKLMPGFVLGVERLPPRLGIRKALLRATPVGQ